MPELTLVSAIVFFFLASLPGRVLQSREWELLSLHVGFTRMLSTLSLSNSEVVKKSPGTTIFNWVLGGREYFYIVFSCCYSLNGVQI